MKILLIKPNPRPQSDGGAVVKSVPLGLLYLAASLRQAGYPRINIVDARVDDLGHKEILALLEKFSPDVVGISGLGTEASETHKLARLAKAASAHCKVVVGGPYASSCPEVIIEDPAIDFVVTGEGERTICELVCALESGRDVSGIDGLAFKTGGIPAVNSRRTTIENVDSIPFPAWDLVDMEKYFSFTSRHSQNPVPASHRLIPIFTSRGCPFGCIYCQSVFGKKTRLRSAENVLREIELLVEKYAPGEIEILDDIFNFDLVRAKQICDGIIKRGIKIRLSFPNGLRADGMDGELVSKLKEAGAHLIFYAIESASPVLQKRIGKRLDLEKAGETIRLTARQGILVGGFFMFGFPEETKEEMLETIRFSRELPFHFAYFFYVTPRPATPLYALLKERNIVQKNAPLCHYFKLSVNLSAVADAELEKLWRKAYAGFYLRPAQVWRIWKALPDKTCILKHLAVILRRCVPA
jgi:radical SAM superfamily enzyme YgiQ (UPF0313 family)